MNLALLPPLGPDAIEKWLALPLQPVCGAHRVAPSPCIVQALEGGIA